MIVSAATIRPETWLCAPAEPLTAVFERLPLTTIPLDSPAAAFAAPSPSSSRLGSTSYPSRAAYVLAAPSPSAKPTSIIPVPELSSLT
jgi:hypothetical protein